MSVIDFAGKLRLEVLTSAHVWSGEELYKGIDYCCKQDQLLIVDPIKILEMNKQYTISNKCNPPANTIVETLSLFDDNVCMPRSIKKHIRLNGRRVIPGSSLKGLLRTAFIYNMIKSDRSLLRQVDNLVATRLQGINTSILMGNRRKAWRDIKGVALPVEELLLKLDLRSIRYSNIKYVLDAFNRVIVSDPLIHENLSYGARTVYVYEIPVLRNSKNPQPRVTVSLEAIEKGSCFIYDLKILKREGFNLSSGNKTGIENLYKKISIDKIIEGLKVFSRDLVKYELERIRGINSKLIEAYRKFLQDIQGKISSREFYLRIGYMTGHNAKTIDLLLTPSTRKLLENVMSSLYNNTWDSLTLKLTRINEKFYGFGWVKITLQG